MACQVICRVVGLAVAACACGRWSSSSTGGPRRGLQDIGRFGRRSEARAGTQGRLGAQLDGVRRCWQSGQLVFAIEGDDRAVEVDVGVVLGHLAQVLEDEDPPRVLTLGEQVGEVAVVEPA